VQLSVVDIRHAMREQVVVHTQQFSFFVLTQDHPPTLRQTATYIYAQYTNRFIC